MLCRRLPFFRFMTFGATSQIVSTINLNLYTAIPCGFTYSRVFQRVSLYTLTGLFILIFIIQLSLLPFGLPLGKFFFPFIGVEVFPNGG